MQDTGTGVPAADGSAATTKDTANFPYVVWFAGIPYAFYTGYQGVVLGQPVLFALLICGAFYICNSFLMFFDFGAKKENGLAEAKTSWALIQGIFKEIIKIFHLLVRDLRGNGAKKRVGNALKIGLAFVMTYYVEKCLISSFIFALKATNIWFFYFSIPLLAAFILVDGYFYLTNFLRPLGVQEEAVKEEAVSSAASNPVVMSTKNGRDDEKDSSVKRNSFVWAVAVTAMITLNALANASLALYSGSLWVFAMSFAASFLLMYNNIGNTEHFFEERKKQYEGMAQLSMWAPTVLTLAALYISVMRKKYTLGTVLLLLPIAWAWWDMKRTDDKKKYFKRWIMPLAVIIGFSSALQVFSPLKNLLSNAGTQGLNNMAHWVGQHILGGQANILFFSLLCAAICMFLNTVLNYLPTEVEAFAGQSVPAASKDVDPEARVELAQVQALTGQDDDADSQRSGHNSGSDTGANTSDSFHSVKL
jgi:hypothetical protein